MSSSVLSISAGPQDQGTVEGMVASELGISGSNTDPNNQLHGGHLLCVYYF